MYIDLLEFHSQPPSISQQQQEADDPGPDCDDDEDADRDEDDDNNVWRLKYTLTMMKTMKTVTKMYEGK